MVKLHVVGAGNANLRASVPQILQIHRDFPAPGIDEVYGRIEEDAVRVCREFQFPHRYLACESLSGPKEVWFLNGWRSSVEIDQVAADYARNAALIAAMERIGKRKAGLHLRPINVFATYRKELSRGTPWTMCRGRFLVIHVTAGNRSNDGTVFETMDGTQFILVPFETHDEAEAHAKTAWAQANIFAIRPYWSFPATEWIAADPLFWEPVLKDSRV